MAGRNNGRGGGWSGGPDDRAGGAPRPPAREAES
jgi:hypothetical protein